MLFRALKTGDLRTIKKLSRKNRQCPHKAADLMEGTQSWRAGIASQDQREHKRVRPDQVSAGSRVASRHPFSRLTRKSDIPSRTPNKTAYERLRTTESEGPEPLFRASTRIHPHRRHWPRRSGQTNNV